MFLNLFFLFFVIECAKSRSRDRSDDWNIRSIEIGGGPVIVSGTHDRNYFRGLDMVQYDPISTNHTSTRLNFEEYHRSLAGTNNGLCNFGVYWTVTSGITSTCNSACANQPAKTRCAGDYPTYNGWPVNKAQLTLILAGLNNEVEAVCGKNGIDVFYGTDDHNPEISSADTDCYIYLLNSTYATNYKCANTVGYEGASRFCPCCVGGKVIFYNLINCS